LFRQIDLAECKALGIKPRSWTNQDADEEIFFKRKAESLQREEARFAEFCEARKVSEEAAREVSQRHWEEQTEDEEKVQKALSSYDQFVLSLDEEEREFRQTEDRLRKQLLALRKISRA
jgi:hypothetical protein